MQHTTKTPLFILASGSPRREYLLKQAGIDVVVIPSSLDESAVPVSSPMETYVRELAEAKALAVADMYPASWVIGADTIVVIEGIILGKPRCPADARQMLRRLSGNTHQVLTGYSLCCRTRNRIFSDAVKTDVQFKALSEAEIEWYIGTQEPFDKAGAYAIQGAGAFFIKRIDGSYTNVVGLPVCEVIEFFLKEGIIGFEGMNRFQKEGV